MFALLAGAGAAATLLVMTMVPETLEVRSRARG
jgi:hypothetical protein